MISHHYGLLCVFALVVVLAEVEVDAQPATDWVEIGTQLQELYAGLSGKSGAYERTVVSASSRSSGRFPNRDDPVWQLANNFNAVTPKRCRRLWKKGAVVDIEGPLVGIVLEFTVDFPNPIPENLNNRDYINGLQDQTTDPRFDAFGNLTYVTDSVDGTQSSFQFEAGVNYPPGSANAIFGNATIIGSFDLDEYPRIIQATAQRPPTAGSLSEVKTFGNWNKRTCQPTLVLSQQNGIQVSKVVIDGAEFEFEQLLKAGAYYRYDDGRLRY